VTSTQAAEARDILATCTASTPRALVAWAVGVIQLGHAIHFVHIPLLPERMGPEYAGGSLDHGRMYLATRKGCVITDGDGMVINVGWREVADLVKPSRVAHLPPRIAVALARRREITGWPNPAGYNAPGAREYREARRVNEVECAAIGDEVWRLCRPVATEEQTSLF
jgi:hypothetical protein